MGVLWRKRWGRRLAEAGATVVCGALGGVMEAAARGASQAGGTVDRDRPHHVSRGRQPALHIRRCHRGRLRAQSRRRGFRRGCDRGGGRVGDAVGVRPCAHTRQDGGCAAQLEPLGSREDGGRPRRDPGLDAGGSRHGRPRRSPMIHLARRPGQSARRARIAKAWDQASGVVERGMPVRASTRSGSRPAGVAARRRSPSRRSAARRSRRPGAAGSRVVASAARAQARPRGGRGPGVGAGPVLGGDDPEATLALLERPAQRAAAPAGRGRDGGRGGQPRRRPSRAPSRDPQPAAHNPRGRHERALNPPPMGRNVDSESTFRPIGGHGGGGDCVGEVVAGGALLVVGPVSPGGSTLSGTPSRSSGQLAALAAAATQPAASPCAARPSTGVPSPWKRAAASRSRPRRKRTTRRASAR